MEELVQRAVHRPYDIPINVAVWMAFKPIIKVYLSIGTGYMLSKSNISTPQLSKGISRLISLIFMPALIFNNIVINIKDTDIKSFGVVVFSGFIYYAIGLGYGFIVWLVSPIPRAWFGGLSLCCMLNNCSDLPLAYVQAIGKTPFLPSDTASRGQSYCVSMTIIFTIFCFNLGGSRLIEWDATRQDPHRADPTVPLLSIEKGIHCIKRWNNKITHTGESSSNSTPSSDNDKSKSSMKSGTGHHSGYDLENQCTEDSVVVGMHDGNFPYSGTDQMSCIGRTATGQTSLRARREHHFGSTDVYYATRRRDSDSSTEYFVDAPQVEQPQVEEDAPVAFQNLSARVAQDRTKAAADTQSLGQKSTKSVKPKSVWGKFRKWWFRVKEKNAVNTYIFNFCEDIFMPQMIALISAVTVAMIPWVRRVFVKGQDIKHFHDAPDQMPPLDFLMEFLSFFAAAQVPLGLMLLGGTIASSKIGKMVKGFWKTLVSICVFKLALLPIIACAWIHRIRAIGWISMDDVMTPIVLSVSAGTPSATVQIYLTLAWMDGTEESLELNCSAVSLLAQYASLPITLTFLMTYIVMHYV